MRVLHYFYLTRMPTDHNTRYTHSSVHLKS